MLEKTSIKIYFKLTEKLDSTVPLPKCGIKFNGTLLEECILDNPNNITTTWQQDHKISVKEYFVDIDDDVEDTYTLEVCWLSKREEVDKILERDPETGYPVDYGVWIQDIEINEISVESLCSQEGKTIVVVCPESEFETHGLLDYLRGKGQIDEVEIKDGECVWTSKNHYIHLDGSRYIFEFKTPMYLWLLELLLQ